MHCENRVKSEIQGIGFFTVTLHSDLSACKVLTKHPPYSPNSVPYDFFPFPKVKVALKGRRLMMHHG